MYDKFRREFYYEFHKLWSESVESPGYNKKDWQVLDRMLGDAWRLRSYEDAERVLKAARRLRDRQSGPADDVLLN